VSPRILDEFASYCEGKFKNGSILDESDGHCASKFQNGVGSLWKPLFLVLNDFGFYCQEFHDRKLETVEVSQFILMYCEMLPSWICPL